MIAPLIRFYNVITGSRGIWWTMAGSVATLGVLRWLLLPNASQDDAEQLLFAQSWQAAYNPAQPPLHTWLTDAAETLFGVGLLPVMLVKFACLFALMVFLYMGAREVLADRRHAALAALSPLAVYYVAYDAVLNYSNTVLMAASCAATFWALAALRRDRRPWRYAVLGVAVGAGLMAKYGFMVFAAALLAAALGDLRLRRRLFDPRIVAAAAVAGVAAVPHYLGWLGAGVDLAEAANARLSLNDRIGYWPGVARGLGKLTNAIVFFPLPLAIVLAIIFPRAFLRTTGWSADALAWKRLLERFALFAILILIAGILLAGVTEVRTHYMFIFLPLSVYAFLRIERAEVKAIAAPVLSAVLIGFAALVAAVLAIKHFTDPLWCRKCYFHYPYPQLAAQFRDAGFADGTVVVHFHRVQVGGNLRLEMPDARFVSTKYPYYLPPERAGAGQCLLVWDAQYFDEPPRELIDFAASKLDIEMPDETARGVVSAPLMHSDREWGLGYVLIPGNGSCR